MDGWIIYVLVAFFDFIIHYFLSILHSPGRVFILPSAITIPLRYQAIVTSSRVKRVIAFVWTLSLVVSVLPFLGWREVRPRTGPGGFCLYHLNLAKSYILFLHVTVCLTPLTITCLAYCKIFQVAKEQAQKIAAMTVYVSM